MAPHYVEDERAKALDAESLAICWQLKDKPALAFWLGAAPVHNGTNVGRQCIERAERRPFKALTHQFHDADVDQIRRVVHHLGGLVHCYDRRSASGWTPAPDLQMRADLFVMPVQRARGDVERRIRRKPQAYF